MSAKTKDKKESEVMRTGDKLRFCADLLRKQTNLVRQVETRANIVIGLSGAAIVFAVNKMGIKDFSLIVPILVGASIVAIGFALMAIKPPSLFSRHGQPSSIFYHTYISKKFTQQSFVKEIEQVSSDVDAVVKQYAMETYNLVKYSLRYKKLFAHLAITIFTFGLFATTLVWFVL